MPVSKEEYMRVGAVKTACADGVDDIRLILAHRELIHRDYAAWTRRPAHPRAQGAYREVWEPSEGLHGLIPAHRELIRE